MKIKRDAAIGVAAFIVGGLFIDLKVNFIGLGFLGVGLYYILKSVIKETSAPAPK